MIVTRRVACPGSLTREFTGSVQRRRASRSVSGARRVSRQSALRVQRGPDGALYVRASSTSARAAELEEVVERSLDDSRVVVLDLADVPSSMRAAFARSFASHSGSGSARGHCGRPSDGDTSS
jgi:hypothetical protein